MSIEHSSEAVKQSRIELSGELNRNNIIFAYIARRALEDASVVLCITFNKPPTPQDVAKIPTEINGVPITTEVIGGIYPQ